MGVCWVCVALRLDDDYAAELASAQMQLRAPTVPAQQQQERQRRGAWAPLLPAGRPDALSAAARSKTAAGRVVAAALLSAQDGPAREGLTAAGGTAPSATTPESSSSSSSMSGEGEEGACDPLEDPSFDGLRAKYAGVTGRTGGKRYREVTIVSLGMKPNKFTMAGLPATSSDVIRALAGKVRSDGQGLDEESLGRANDFFGGGASGLAACKALDALCRMGSIDTMLATFIQPLQKLVDAQSRVHCSLNFNTETGRLSSRKPNLQNQPALEKDQYKVLRDGKSIRGRKEDKFQTMSLQPAIPLHHTQNPFCLLVS
jgi:hypothetical protein